MISTFIGVGVNIALVTLLQFGYLHLVQTTRLVVSRTTPIYHCCTQCTLLYTSSVLFDPCSHRCYWKNCFVHMYSYIVTHKNHSPYLVMRSPKGRKKSMLIA